MMTEKFEIRFPKWWMKRFGVTRIGQNHFLYTPPPAPKWVWKWKSKKSALEAE